MKSLPVERNTAPIHIGPRLRAARHVARLTIEQVAESTGLTKGFISRIERDLTSPSVATLMTLCQVLGIPVGELFEVPETNLYRVGQGARIDLGGTGIEEELITPRHEHRLQMIRAVIEPGGKGEDELYGVDCDLDVVHVVEGKFTLIFARDRYRLLAGDTFSFPGREPHTWVNDGETETVVIWTLVPAAWR